MDTDIIDISAEAVGIVCLLKAYSYSPANRTGAVWKFGGATKRLSQQLDYKCISLKCNQQIGKKKQGKKM